MRLTRENWFRTQLCELTLCRGVSVSDVSKECTAFHLQSLRGPRETDAVYWSCSWKPGQEWRSITGGEYSFNSDFLKRRKTVAQQLSFTSQKTRLPNKIQWKSQASKWEQHFSVRTTRKKTQELSTKLAAVCNPTSSPAGNAVTWMSATRQCLWLR
jgi:hypothetical protein